MTRRPLLLAATAVAVALTAHPASAQGSAASLPAPVDSLRSAVADSVGPPLLGRPVPATADAPAPAALAPAAGVAALQAAEVAGKAPEVSTRFEPAHGVSGALRAAIIRNGLALDLAPRAAPQAVPARPRWVPVHGTVRRGLLGEPVSAGAVIAPDGAGVWRLEVADSSADVAVAESLLYITPVPFHEKRDGHLNGYHIGTYPTEIAPRSDVYAPPEGFIEVTPENQDVQVSEHFRLRHFLTKDQFEVWPKYLALNLRLVDKLELVIQELNAMGVRALGIHVMSGFRTPQYNGPGGDGRATLSRHMYGDAADVWVDGDSDGYIDDLNGDGRHDIRDAEVLLRAVERVEQKYPELTGGAGLYEANDHHGPYVHVDVRGTRARW